MSRIVDASIAIIDAIRPVIDESIIVVCVDAVQAVREHLAFFFDGQAQCGTIVVQMIGRIKRPEGLMGQRAKRREEVVHALYVHLPRLLDSLRHVRESMAPAEGGQATLPSLVINLD